MGQGDDGAGHVVANQASGGNVDITLSTGQLPAHNHSASQPDHSHTSPAHNHGLTQLYQSATQNGADSHRVNVEGVDLPVSQTTDDTAVTINSASAGAITIGNTGSGEAIDVTNQYYALIYAKKLY
jgi:hypothetical protein